MVGQSRPYNTIPKNGLLRSPSARNLLQVAPYKRLYYKATQEDDVPQRELNFDGATSSSVIPIRPTFTPQENFRISTKRFQEAANASPGTTDSYWQYDMYEKSGKGISLHYCTDLETSEDVVQLFRGVHTLGLDLEWSAMSRVEDDLRTNVSVVQLASEDRVAIFHLAKFPEHSDEFVAPTLREILEDPRIVKAGVAIGADCTRLRRVLGLECRGIVELSHYHKLIKYFPHDPSLINKRLVNLATQVQEHLNLPMLKGSIQVSDWSSVLSLEQVRYAASDAYAGLQLLHHLERKRLLMDPQPPAPAYNELKLPLSKVIDSPTCEQPYLDADELISDLSSEDSFPDSPEISSQELERLFQKSSLDPAGLPVRCDPDDMVLENAEIWAAAERDKQGDPKQRTPLRFLKAYHLCYIQRLKVEKVCSILRKVPLQPITVMGYVCDAIILSRLPADPQWVVEFGSIPPHASAIARQQLLDRAKEEVQRRQGFAMHLATTQDDVQWHSGLAMLATQN